MDHTASHELAVTAAKARLLGMDMVHRAASGHIGGSLSADRKSTRLNSSHT